MIYSFFILQLNFNPVGIAIALKQHIPKTNRKCHFSLRFRETLRSWVLGSSENSILTVGEFRGDDCLSCDLIFLTIFKIDVICN